MENGAMLRSSKYQVPSNKKTATNMTPRVADLS